MPHNGLGRARTSGDIGAPNVDDHRMRYLAPAVALVATLAASGCGGSGETIHQGWAYVDQDGFGIGCCGSTPAKAGGNGYAVAGALWRDLHRQGSGWSDAVTPNCLQPLKPNHIRLATVTAPAHGDAPGRQVVVWFECL